MQWMVRRHVFAISVLFGLSGCAILTGSGSGPLNFYPQTLWAIQSSMDSSEMLTSNYLAIAHDGSITRGSYCYSLLYHQRNCAGAYSLAIDECEKASGGQKCSIFSAEDRVLWNLPTPTHDMEKPVDGHWRNIELSIPETDIIQMGVVTWRPFGGAFKTPEDDNVLQGCTGQLVPAGASAGRWNMSCLNGETATGNLEPSNGSELIGQAISNEGRTIRIVVQ